MALGHPAMWIRIRRPCSAIPDDHRAPAIFSLRDDPLPFEIVHRVVFGLNRQPLVAGNKARTAGDGPAFQHSVELKPQIEMQATRIMPLHDKLAALRFANFWLRFGGAG